MAFNERFMCMGDKPLASPKSKKFPVALDRELTADQIAFAWLLGDLLARKWAHDHAISSNNATPGATPPVSIDSEP
jgi:hypothetical protein